MKIKELFADKEKNTKIFPYALGFFAVTSFVGYFMLVFGFNSLNNKLKASPRPSPFAEISISARSAIVVDISTGEVLFEKNADEPLPLASITKVMTALTAVENAPTLQEVEIKSEDLSAEGDSGLFLNSKWDLKGLIDYSLLVSSNDGASAIASAVGAFQNNSVAAKQTFVNDMNILATIIGMSNTRFFNEHGLDRGENNVGSYGSARDVAKLLSYALTKYPSLLEATRYGEMSFRDKDGILYIAHNTNISTNQIPNLLASKTGFTDLAGGNLAIAFDAGLGRPIVISVLGSTQEDRFLDVLKLASTTLEYFKEN